MLGKGGFAICYEGQLLGKKKKYALKIVKSKMPTKMEQKVSFVRGTLCLYINRIHSSKPNFRSTPR
jgi:hypothetical protein